MPTCTIVVPCFNEAKRLNLHAFIDHVQRHDHSFLFVNDGSCDETRDVLEDLCDVDRALMSAIHLGTNQGKAEAVRRGMLHAFRSQAPFMGYWDADLATPLEAISDFEKYLCDHEQVEMLFGSRVRMLGRRIERRPARHCLGRLFATAAATTLNLPVYDTQCGAKLLRATPRVRQLFRRPFRTRWLFDVELVARFQQSLRQSGETNPESSIHEWPLNEWRDVAGSKVKPTDFLRAIWQLAQIRLAYRCHPHTADKLAMPRGEIRESEVVVAANDSAVFSRARGDESVSEPFETAVSADHFTDMDASGRHTSAPRSIEA